MRPSSRFGVFLLCSFLAAGCSGSAEEEEVDEGALTEAGEALEAEDFTKALSKQFIADTHASLSRASFDAKWQASVQAAPLMFYRSYPGAYHADFAQNLSAAGKKKIPSAVGICVGDAHPDNFGFLRFGRRTVYGYNDLDDSGHCPVALDVLRYVAAVQLFFDDNSLTEHAVKRYIDVLTGVRTKADAEKDIADIREDAPDFASRRVEKLEDLAKGDALVRSDEMSEVSTQAKRSIESALGVLPNVTMLDAVKVARDSGGSAGLDRYWVFVQKGNIRTVLELKERSKPGVEFGLSSREMPVSSRLATLKTAIWATDTTDDYVYTQAFGKTFLVRDRLAKASLDSLELKKKQREDLIEAQTSILGLLHKKAFAPRDEEGRKAYAKWLEKSAKTIVDRWKRARR